ncbi:MAG TPA: DUF4058 family protein [Gemmataceae bacterium]|nr:DUF4058 family protein [Gemmataceae bacterium]
MPIHDWTRVRPGRFHHFHQRWIGAIGDALNTGLLPPGYFALAEQKTGGPEPDVVTLKLPPKPGSEGRPVGTAVADVPPKVRYRTESEAANYARRADRLTVRNEDGDVVAIIELVSPGNKDSRNALRQFTREAAQFLHAGINLLIVDLFPPSRRDPQGIHKAIWDRIRDEPFELPKDKPLTLAAYTNGSAITGYVEPVAVGDPLPGMPIFLTPDRYVPCPLETTYTTAWAVFPSALKGDLERPPS